MASPLIEDEKKKAPSQPKPLPRQPLDTGTTPEPQLKQPVAPPPGGRGVLDTYGDLSLRGPIPVDTATQERSQASPYPVKVPPSELQLAPPAPVPVAVDPLKLPGVQADKKLRRYFDAINRVQGNPEVRAALLDKAAQRVKELTTMGYSLPTELHSQLAGMIQQNTDQQQRDQSGGGLRGDLLEGQTRDLNANTMREHDLAMDSADRTLMGLPPREKTHEDYANEYGIDPDRLQLHHQRMAELREPIELPVWTPANAPERVIDWGSNTEMPFTRGDVLYQMRTWNAGNPDKRISYAEMRQQMIDAHRGRADELDEREHRQRVEMTQARSPEKVAKAQGRSAEKVAKITGTSAEKVAGIKADTDRELGEMQFKLGSEGNKLQQYANETARMLAEMEGASRITQQEMDFVKQRMQITQDRLSRKAAILKMRLDQAAKDLANIRGKFGISPDDKAKAEKKVEDLMQAIEEHSRAQDTLSKRYDQLLLRGPNPATGEGGTGDGKPGNFPGNK